MGFVEKLLCVSTKEAGGDARLPHTRTISALSRPLYTHITTLFENRKGLLSFVSKFRHDRNWPQDSVKHIFVPHEKVVAVKQLDLLYEELPQIYRAPTPQPDDQYNSRKLIHAHLTTVFEETQALFSFFLEFELEHKHPTDYIKYKFPHPDKVIHLRKMSPLCKRLSDVHPNTQSSDRSGRATPDETRNMRRMPMSKPVQHPRQVYSESTGRARYQALNRSLSAAAARTSMYGSAETSQPLKRLAEMGRQPAESISYLSGTARPRRNTLKANIGKPSASHGAVSTDNSIGLKGKKNTDSRSTQDPRMRMLRLERHSSQDLRKEYIESCPSRQTLHHDTHKRTELRTEIEVHEVHDTTGSYTRPRESYQEQRDPRTRQDTLPQPVRRLAQAGGSSFTEPTIEVEINPWDEELPAIARNVISPIAELYHNPFAESTLSISRTKNLLQPRYDIHGGKRSSSQERSAHFDDQQLLPKETGPSRPRRKPILKPSRSGESLDQRKVHFDIDTPTHEDMGPDLSHRPADDYPQTLSVPPPAPSPSITDLAANAASSYSSYSTKPSTSTDACKQCDFHPRSINTKGYCQPCWSRVDPAEKLLCGRCYETYTGRYEDSQEVLTMCERCFGEIERVERERRGMGWYERGKIGG